MHGRMDGQMDGRINGRMDRRMVGRMDGWMDGPSWTDGCPLSPAVIEGPSMTGSEAAGPARPRRPAIRRGQRHRASAGQFQQPHQQNLVTARFLLRPVTR